MREIRASLHSFYLRSSAPSPITFSSVAFDIFTGSHAGDNRGRVLEAPPNHQIRGIHYRIWHARPDGSSYLRI